MGWWVQGIWAPQGTHPSLSTIEDGFLRSDTSSCPASRVEPAAPPGRTVTQLHHHGGGETRYGQECTKTSHEHEQISSGHILWLSLTLKSIIILWASHCYSTCRSCNLCAEEAGMVEVKNNFWNTLYPALNTHIQQAASALSEFSPPSPSPALHRCRWGRGNGWRFTDSSLPDVRVLPILMYSLLTEPSGHERARDRAHPSIGALPSGPGASQTAWELAGLSARQPSWSSFGCFQYPAGSKMCTSHFTGHIWVVVAPQSDCAGVCSPCSPKTTRDSWRAGARCFVFVVKTRLPVSLSLHAALELYICNFFFFCSLSQTWNRRLPDIYPLYGSSHHPRLDSHSLQGKMQGASLHSLLDVPGKPPRQRATCWLKLAGVYIYQHTGCECGRGEAEGHRSGLSGHQGATCTQWEIQTQLLKCQLKVLFLHLLLLKMLATPSVFFPCISLLVGNSVLLPCFCLFTH